MRDTKHVVTTYVGSEGVGQMGCHGSSSQFILLYYLTSKYGNVLSIHLMILKTDFRPTFGAKINTMQLNGHIIHPALVQKSNSASMMRADLRGSCENQEFLAGHRPPHQPIGRQPRYTNEGFDRLRHLDQGPKGPICSLGSSDQIHSHPFTSLGCIFGSALASVYEGQ